MATMTLIGLYNWDSDLFSMFSVPSGLDRDVAIKCILTRAGGFEVLYPDYDFMREMIGLISKKWARTFQKWYDALELEYNPIENYDRHEDWTDTDNRQTDSTSSDESQAKSQTDTSVNTYDSEEMHPDGRSISSQNSSSGGKDSTTDSGTSAHTGHTHGNIGVTTSQQMLEAELDLQEWNLYEHISDIFVRELCIPVY